MDIVIIVLQSVLVLLGIGIFGFWITKRGIIPEGVLGILSRLAIDLALPCMVFASILVNFTPSDYPGWWQLPIWWFFFAAVSLILTVLAMPLSSKSTRSEFGINLFYQNGLFFPLIIISGIFGNNSPYLTQLYIFIALHPVMFFSTYYLFFGKAKKQGERHIQWSRIFNPILIATLLAVGVQLFGIKNYLPDFIRSIMQILGGMALPLIMIILGGSLYLDFKQKSKFYVLEVIKFLTIKNLVFPLVFLGLLVILKSQFDISYNIAMLLILQSAVPPITGTPIMTERVGGNKSISNQFVFSSFIFSVISIPFIFRLFSEVFPLP
jgi:predicted permease